MATGINTSSLTFDQTSLSFGSAIVNTESGTSLNLSITNSSDELVSLYISTDKSSSDTVDSSEIEDILKAYTFSWEKDFVKSNPVFSIDPKSSFVVKVTFKPNTVKDYNNI